MNLRLMSSFFLQVFDWRLLLPTHAKLHSTIERLEIPAVFYLKIKSVMDHAHSGLPVLSHVDMVSTKFSIGP